MAEGSPPKSGTKKRTSKPRIIVIEAGFNPELYYPDSIWSKLLAVSDKVRRMVNAVLKRNGKAFQPKANHPFALGSDILEAIKEVDAEIVA